MVPQIQIVGRRLVRDECVVLKLELSLVICERFYGTSAWVCKGVILVKDCDTPVILDVARLPRLEGLSPAAA